LVALKVARLADLWAVDLVELRVDATVDVWVAMKAALWAD
jgi:hypothetical protein